MSDVFDVAVVGLGAMGSAIARNLARRGQSVVGFDLHSPPHDRGSSHGHSRMIREAYYEHPLYVPLVRRAYELWHELERENAGAPFFIRTGGLMVGAESGTLVQGTLRSAAEHRIPHELLSPEKLRRRFPAFAPLPEMVGVLEERAGILLPDRIIAANLESAARHGAELHAGEGVIGWETVVGGVELRAGERRHRARQVVFAAGAWTAQLLRELSIPLEVERQVLHWLEPEHHPEYFAPDRMPVSLWELPSGAIFHTKPDLGDGVKVGMHHGGVTTTPEGLDRRVTPEEDAAIYDLLRRFLPFAKGAIRERGVCMYTNTPDRDFIIDRHPATDAAIIVSACSGHGFKFAPAIAEAVADLVERREPRCNLAPFGMARLAQAAQ
jgi:sarcosine oxidase